MNKTVLLALALFLPVAFLAFLFTRDTELVKPPETDSSALERITLANIPLFVSIADSDAKRRQGLSGRERLGENEGMLFIFDTDSRWGIWMKGMRFPLDILWIDADRRVVYIEHSVAPETYPKTYRPETPARYVLELPAGFAEARGLGTGDLLEL